MADYTKRGVLVVGVSADDAASHASFREKHRLNFPLVPDPDRRIIEAYGVKGLFGVASRVTFVIGRDGRIARVFRKVSPAANADEVLSALDSIGSGAR
jgi:peroxiredoxin Q/BCP